MTHIAYRTHGIRIPKSTLTDHFLQLLSFIAQKSALMANSKDQSMLKTTKTTEQS